MNTAIPVDQAQLRARAAVYHLLSQLWLREVDADLLHALRRPPLRGAFVAAGGVLPDDAAKPDTLEALAIDFCQLFLGPSGHLPPHQSVWISGHFQGEATVAMQSEYEALHLPQPGGMADHLGAQLGAMAVVLERLAAENSASTSDLDAAQKFFRERLDWTDDLTAQAEARAQTTFYRGMVTMSRAFLAEERADWLGAD